MPAVFGADIWVTVFFKSFVWGGGVDFISIMNGNGKKKKKKAMLFSCYQCFFLIELIGK